MKPLNEKSAASREFAPHSELSGVGFVEDELYFPEASNVDAEMTSTSDSYKDSSVKGRIRGKEKVGGELHPIIPVGVQTYPRKPMLTTPASNLEFTKLRKKQTIGEKLAEVTALRDKIRLQRLALMEEVTLSAKKQNKDVSVEDEVEEIISLQKSAISLNKSKSIKFQKSNAHINSIPKGKINKIERTLPKIMHASNLDNDKTTLINSQSDNDLLNKFENDNNINSAEFSKIENEILKLQNDLNKFVKDEFKLIELKNEQREFIEKERALVIERKRRLLNKSYKVTKGAITDDPNSVYDYYIIRIQACARGWLRRMWIQRYRRSANKAATLIQAITRGFLARLKVNRMKLRDKAARKIQVHVRGFLARVSEIVIIMG